MQALSIPVPNVRKYLKLLPLILSIALVNVAEARNPQVSAWMKNLSYTANLEPPGAVIWKDELGDLSVSGNTVHSLWFGTKGDYSDRHFVYRRSIDSGRHWLTEQELVSHSASGGTLYGDLSAKYLCVNGKTVHVIMPISYPITPQRSWYFNLYYYRSTDNGKSFEPARVIAEGADIWHITQPRISCNNERVVIGYKYHANGYANYHINLLISDSNGDRFRATTPITNNKQDGTLEDLLLVGKDIYVLHRWVLEPYYYGNFQARIGLASSVNDGRFRNRWLSTRAKDGRFYALGTKDLYNSPNLAVVGSTVYVVWNQLDTNYNGVKTLLLRRSTDKGRTFGTPIKLYSGSELAVGQETIAAQGNYVYVIFPTTDSKMHLRRSTTEGRGFKPDQVISPGGWWPEVVIDPRDTSGASLYTFWDAPTYRYSRNGGASFDNPLAVHQVFSFGRYQRSHRKVATNGLVHFITNASYYSSSLCGGICDDDIFYRRLAPNPDSKGMGRGLRLFTHGQAFEDRADNMQVLAKTLNFSKQMTAEVWVKDLGGGIATGHTDYRTPILFKQRDLSTGYYPGFSLGTVDGGSGTRRVVAEIQTSQGRFEVRGQDTGLLDAKKWTHLAMTYNAGQSTDNFKLYKNGELVNVATLTGNIDAGIGNFFVGRYGNWIVDEVRLWNRALSQKEIKTNMSHALSGKEANLQAYFPFENTALDVTGHGNDGLFMYKEQYTAGKY